MTARRSPHPRRAWWIIPAFAGGVLAVLVGISFAQEVQRRIALQRHVQSLQEEIHRREKNIVTLEQLTEYLRTDAYRERAAREKLNYQRTGEQVVVIPESGTVLDAEDARVETRALTASSIPYQWWAHVFGDRE